MKNAFLLIISALFIIGGIYFLVSSPRKETPKFVFEPTRPASQTENSKTETDEEPALEGKLNKNNQKEFIISNNIFAFSPKRIAVNKGDKVKIIFKNTGGTHDLKIDGYNIGTHITQNGKEDEFEFTADKAGTFEYYCSVGNHRQMGMTGTIIVK